MSVERCFSQHLFQCLFLQEGDTGEQALALLEADGERRVAVIADFQPEGCGRGGEAQLCMALQ